MYYPVFTVLFVFLAIFVIAGVKALRFIIKSDERVVVQEPPAQHKPQYQDRLSYGAHGTGWGSSNTPYNGTNEPLFHIPYGVDERFGPFGKRYQ